MKILSIDVGIKNLAFCLFEKSQDSEHFLIKKWDIVNISDSKENVQCKCVDKNIICNKPAKFKKEDAYYCLKHSKKQILQIPGPEQKSSYINKQKIQKLYDIADAHKIIYDSKIKKIDLIHKINEYIHDNYFEKVESIKAANVDLFHIGLHIKNKFNKLFENEEIIDYVIIENQISPIATRMKTIQGMIVQYFIMSNIVVNNMEFISAANKLKDCDATEKCKYNDRKKLAIAKCLEIITNDFRFNEHVNYFTKHTKKDDLSDSFLQGLWFLKHNHL